MSWCRRPSLLVLVGVSALAVVSACSTAHPSAHAADGAGSTSSPSATSPSMPASSGGPPWSSAPAGASAAPVVIASPTLASRTPAALSPSPSHTATPIHTATPKPTASRSLAPTQAPPVVVPPPATSGELAGKVIVLDPGHNLNNSASINQPVYAGNGVTKACDTVGTSTPGGYPEHAFTFDVATRAAAVLRAEGATVILTRPNDAGIGPCITTRAQIGNDAHADAFIAIHADGGPSGGHGFFVMQPPPNNPNVNPGGASRSRVLARVVHDVFHAVTGIPYSSYIANGYYPDSGYTGTINLSHGPVITIECLDMRNSGDAAVATNPASRQSIAAGIAAGLTTFLTGS